MRRNFEINRLELTILVTLHDMDMCDQFRSMTISELLEENEGALGARMTVYKRLKKLMKDGYVDKGIIDNHADTYFITNKGIQLLEGGN